MDKPLEIPLVSVIVPCYNHGRFLVECLESVLTQTFINWECIVVDNGSTDNTKALTDSFTKKDSRFHYLYSDIKGVSLARNLGIKSGKGKYILPLDADDKIGNTYLEQALTVLEKNEEIKLVYCNAKLFGDSSGEWILPDFSVKGLLIENLIFCSALYRKSDFENTQGYNELMIEGFEDWDFWLSFISKDNQVYRISDFLFFYRIRKESRNNSLDIEKQRELRRLIFNNHKELYGVNFNMSDLVFDLYTTKKKLENTDKSYQLKIGKLILKPLRILNNLLKGA